MQRAMDESERRRKVQVKFNQEHGITPTSIKKQVKDIIEASVLGEVQAGGLFKAQKIEEQAIDYAKLSAKELGRQLAELDKKMLQHAKDLEFEQAAKVRDEIDHICKTFMGLSE